MVGAIVGSSILSVLIFYLILRYRRRRRRQSREAAFRRDIGYPKAEPDDDRCQATARMTAGPGAATGRATMSYGFPADLKERIQSLEPRFKPMPGRASSVYGDDASSTGSPPSPMSPPMSIGAVAVRQPPAAVVTLERRPSAAAAMVERKPSFAASPYVRQLPLRRPSGRGLGFGGGPGASSRAGGGGGGTPARGMSNRSVFPRAGSNGALDGVDEREAKEVSGELKNWLGNATTVSPFSTLVKGSPDQARSG